MQKFFFPQHKKRFIKWLLETSVHNNWTIVLEHSTDNIVTELKKYATTVPLPSSTKHEYDSNCKFTAITQPEISDVFVDAIISLSHVMSIHDQKEMLFLIADDYHQECFSCTENFYEKYYQVLDSLGLIGAWPTERWVDN